MSNPVLDWGRGTIEWLQSIPGLAGPAEVFAAIGDVGSMLVWIPIVLWSVDGRLGRRLMLGLTFWGALNTPLKLAAALPRPYWVEGSVVPAAAEPSFGLPSGHAGFAVTTLGRAALEVTRPSRLLLITLIGLIGASRVVLGVHWPADVLAGWVFGIALLIVAVKYLEPLMDRAQAWPRPAQLVLAANAGVVPLGVAVLLADVRNAPTRFAAWAELADRAPDPIDPVALVGAAALCGGLAGVILGWCLDGGHFDADGSPRERLMRVPAGLAGLWLITRAATLVPDHDIGRPVAAWLTGAAAGWWILDGAPRVFRQFGLVSHSSEPRPPVTADG